MTTGRGYGLLKAAMERLAGTRISTNVTTGGKEIFETFGLIESARIVRETRDGRMQEIEIKLSDWVFNAIRAHEVLTISRDYFRCAAPWNGGSTSSRASIAATRRNGSWGWIFCRRNAAHPRPASSSGASWPT